MSSQEQATMNDGPSSPVDVLQLQRALRERDDRIASLERELADKNARLASARAVEDQLFVELNKMSLALADATATAEGATAEDEDAKPSSASTRPRVSTSDLSMTSGEGTREAQAEVGTYQVPTGQPIQVPTAGGYTGSSRLNPGSCASGIALMNSIALNPGSCASGINLLNGLLSAESVGSSDMSLERLDSTGSLHFMLGMLSGANLKRQKSGDEAGGGRRSGGTRSPAPPLNATNHEQYHGQRNDTWNINAPTPSSSSMLDGPQQNLLLSLLGTMSAKEGVFPTTNQFGGQNRK